MVLKRLTAVIANSHELGNWPPNAANVFASKVIFGLCRTAHNAD